MSVTITIHYQSPAGDPFKVPRPHRVVVDESGNASDVQGGEYGVHALRLVGFCPTVTPDVDDWKVTLADELYDGAVTADALAGQYPQFVGDEGGIFGYGHKIERIEVTEAAA